MFKPSSIPRVFGLPLGVDFPKSLVQGLLDRCDARAPEFMPTVEVYVSTQRMQRRVRDIFDAGPRCFCPAFT